MKTILTAAALTSSSLAFAHGLPTGTTWKSDYIIGKGQFTLNVLNQEDVSVTEDRNSCGLNELGDVTFCTLMFFEPIEGKLVAKPVAAPRTTVLYELVGSKYQIVHNITEEASRTIRLLKVDENGYITDVVRLLKN